MRRLETMLADIQQRLDLDRPRAEAADQCRADARALTRRFPLVHRSVKANGPRLSDILATRRLLAEAPCTPRELDCGIERAVYFFLGCGAFPEGAVAFLASAAVLNTSQATYTPFDTGSLEHHASPREASAPWRGSDKDSFLANHLGFGNEALTFSIEYIAAHFKSPPDYVRRQQRSDPDFPTYHGLVSRSGDRRAWSIEIQLHDDLALDVQHLDAIILGQPDLLADIPDDLVEKVVISEAEGSITTTIHQLIVPEQPT